MSPPEAHPDQTAPDHGDIARETLRAALHRAADIMADYLQHSDRYPVVPRIEPGDVRKALAAEPPESGEPLDRLLDDYQRLIEPNVTHWNHPGFLAYFAITGSGPGVLGEMLTAALNVNAMLWRTGPAPTELEEHVCDWLRQMLGLPTGFVGHINDTASISTMLALAAARERAGLDVRSRGLAGRPDLPTLTLYCSDQAHSSVEKAALTLGLGLENVRRVRSDDRFEMDASALRSAIEDDRRSGRRPMAIVATLGTTSTTAVDPVAEIADIAHLSSCWLHVDAAYAGSAAVCPEFRSHFSGWERADSIVFNPHKWLFVPVDCSVLYVRNNDALRRTFSIVPAYLATSETNATNLMDLGIQLGRRFRALKVWFVIRAFGVSGIRDRIRAHCEMAREFAEWVRGDPDFEVAAPAPFSTVCFAARAESPDASDRLNERLLAEINAAGPFLLSQTRLRERFVLRLAIGNLRTTREHLVALWRLIRDLRRRIDAGS